MLKKTLLQCAAYEERYHDLLLILVLAYCGFTDIHLHRVGALLTRQAKKSERVKSSSKINKFWGCKSVYKVLKYLLFIQI